jgi:Zn finger protein HypA/HybF involved in hydrogenase expression
MSIVETAREQAERRGVQVPAVHLRLGALSGVVKDAVFFLRNGLSGYATRRFA